VWLTHCAGHETPQSCSHPCSPTHTQAACSHWRHLLSPRLRVLRPTSAQGLRACWPCRRPSSSPWCLNCPMAHRDGLRQKKEPLRESQCVNEGVTQTKTKRKQAKERVNLVDKQSQQQRQHVSKQPGLHLILMASHCVMRHEQNASRASGLSCSSAHCCQQCLLLLGHCCGSNGLLSKMQQCPCSAASAAFRAADTRYTHTVVAVCTERHVKWAGGKTHFFAHSQQQALQQPTGKQVCPGRVLVPATAETATAKSCQLLQHWLKHACQTASPRMRHMSCSKAHNGHTRHCQHQELQGHMPCYFKGSPEDSEDGATTNSIRKRTVLHNPKDTGHIQGKRSPRLPWRIAADWATSQGLAAHNSVRPLVAAVLQAQRQHAHREHHVWPGKEWDPETPGNEVPGRLPQLSKACHATGSVPQLLDACAVTQKAFHHGVLGHTSLPLSGRQDSDWCES
jgi:hypothetical protein